MERTTNENNGVACSFVLLLVSACFVPGFGGKYELVQAAAELPLHYLPLPLPPLFSLFELCQTTVSIAVCLPSSENHLAGESQTHTLTHFVLRVSRGAKGHNPASRLTPQNTVTVTLFSNL